MTAPNGMCAYYDNLGSHGFSDQISPVMDNSDGVQSFWQHANFAGWRLTVSARRNIGQLGYWRNDAISSMISNG